MMMRNTSVVFRSGLLALCFVAGAAHSQFLETTIRVGQWPQAILWNPTSNKVYTANNLDNTVTVIDGVTNQVRATLAVANFPLALCWNSVTNKVYCLCPEDNIVEVIDGWGDSVMARVRVANYPSHVAFNATMNKLYVSRTDAGSLAVIDGSVDTVLREIPVSSEGPSLMLWHPGTNRLFCTGDSVAVIDCVTDEVVAGMPMTATPYQWCYNPANGLVYLGGSLGTYVFSARGDSLLTEVPGKVWWLCAVPYTNKLYLYDWEVLPRLRVLDCGSNTVTDSVPVFGGPMVCDTTNGKVYASCYGSHNLVSVLDALADTVLDTIPLPGPMPGALCWNSTNSRVYVAEEMGDMVYVLRDTTAGIEQTGPAAALRRVRRGAVVREVFLWQEAEFGQVVDAGGRKVAEVRPGQNDLSRLPAGVYVVVCADAIANTRFLKLR